MLAENQDDDCFVCFDLMCEPAKTPCGHYLCLTCLQNVLLLKRCCPFCRTQVTSSYIPKIDKVKQKDIKNRREPAFMKRMKEVKAQRLSSDTLKLVYGNMHESIETTAHNSHAWTAFVRLADESLDISKYIKKVVFTLHPTFRDPIIEINHPPFTVKRIGWGVFMIPIVIHWQPWLEKEPTKVRHYLSFSGEGVATTEDIKFSKSVFQNVDEEDDDDGVDECNYEI